ncbi:MAG TPA: hypothetical protein VJ922_07485 [Actinomycetota bacterium]|nr:hypothetical protein [Actinomycetota bacterium]
MYIDKPSKKLLLSILLSATNIASFAFGITVAGERKAQNVDVVAAPFTASADATTSPTPKAKVLKPPAPGSVSPAPKGTSAPAAAAVPRTYPIAGKGMWIYEFQRIGRGDAHAIVAAAKRNGLTHLYVRAGTSRSGLNTWPDVARILPIAHAAGIKVIPWFFVYLHNPTSDVRRTVAVLRADVGGHRVDGFAADIETPAEGTRLSSLRMRNYIDAVRRWVPDAFMVLVPPRPNRYTIRFYPYHLVPRFNAVAPMVYWGSVDPARATAEAVSYLKRYRRPIAPVGQVYDMGPEGGPKGRPSAHAVHRFMAEAHRRGSIGVSFWSWQHSAPWHWNAIRVFPGWKK